MIPDYYLKGHKNCAVCDYWDGIRKVEFLGRLVTIESEKTEGKCLRESGPCEGQNRFPRASCDGWQVWRALSP